MAWLCRNLQQRAVVDQALLVQPVHDRVMAEGRAALVHQLGLPLRIEILREIAHDAQQLALPGSQPGRVLLEEIQQVLLRQPQAALALARLLLAEVVSRAGARPGTVRQRSL